MAVEDFRKSGSPTAISAAPFPSSATGLGDALVTKPVAGALDADASRRFRLRIVAKPRVLLKVSMASILHVPADERASLADDGAHFLCPHFDVRPRGPAKANRKTTATPIDVSNPVCPDGDACPYVHADISNAQFLTPHSTATVALRGPVPTYAAGTLVPVRLTDAPGTAPFMCPSSRLMRNKALACDDQGRLAAGQLADPVPLCLQLALRQRCDRGARCSFAHIVPSGGCAADDAGVDDATLPQSAVAGPADRDGRLASLVRRGSGPPRSLSAVSRAASAGALSTVATSGQLGCSGLDGGMRNGSGTPSVMGTPLSFSGKSSPRRRSSGATSPYGADPRL
jgi:hypothetical protein